MIKFFESKLRSNKITSENKKDRFRKTFREFTF